MIRRLLTPFFTSTSSYHFGRRDSAEDDDDVFLTSPVRRAFRSNQTLAAQIADNTSINARTTRAVDQDDYHNRSSRSVTTPAALALGTTPGDRAYRTPSSRAAFTPRNVTGPRNEIAPRTENETVDAQGIYPPSACVFVAK